MEHRPKFKKTTRPFYLVFQGLKVLFTKSSSATSSFISYCVTLAFTSADIIFHNFLELQSILSEKYFRHEFSFLMGPQPHTSLRQKSAKRDDERFWSMFP